MIGAFTRVDFNCTIQELKLIVLVEGDGFVF